MLEHTTILKTAVLNILQKSGFLQINYNELACLFQFKFRMSCKKKKKVVCYGMVIIYPKEICVRLQLSLWRKGEDRTIYEKAIPSWNTQLEKTMWHAPKYIILLDSLFLEQTVRYCPEWETIFQHDLLQMIKILQKHAETNDTTGPAICL